MRVTRSFKAMGSPCELQLYIKEGTDPDAIFQDLIGEVVRFEDKYSRYKSNSVISQINASAGSGTVVPIDAEAAKLFDYADALYQQSDGLFDITSGVLREVWDFRSADLPSESDIEAVLPLIGWHYVERDDGHVYLPREGMQVDFGGFGKEYAVDLLASRCVDNDIQHGMVNLGGDVRVIGPHPDGAPWRIGIQHPRAHGKTIAIIDLHGGAVATSGDYERFMLIDGRRYCHLLDPKTGHSLEPEFASVSVLADSCLLAGSFSTLAMLMREGAAEWLQSTGLPHLLVDKTLALSGSIGFRTD